MKLNSKIIIALLDLLFNGRARGYLSTVRRTEAKAIEYGLLGPSINAQRSAQWTRPLSKKGNYLLSPYNSNNLKLTDGTVVF